MPQVANQDYNYIIPKQGRAAKDDAACMAQLRKAVLMGTIWDCIIKYPTNYEEVQSCSRVIGLYDVDCIYIFDTYNAEMFYIEVPFTVEQYEGLSAIQLAEDVFYGEAMVAMPSLGMVDDKYLSESANATLVCVDGYKLIATASGDKLTALSISQDKPDPDTDFINITWEDAQKLIGLPIS